MDDRFIPNRSRMDMEHAGTLLLPMMPSTPSSSVSVPVPPSREEYRRRIREALSLDSDGRPFRMLVFGGKPKSCRKKIGFEEDEPSLLRPRPASVRHLPKYPSCVLDAVNILDDFSVNTLDWGKNNMLAVALGQTVHIRNQATGKTRELLTADDDVPTSVSWSADGKILAVGLAGSRITLWDVATSRCVRTLTMHEDKVGSLSWNDNILTSGSRDAAIVNHDVRVERPASFYYGHSGEVCGLRWSEGGNLLASGGGDKLVHVWEASNMSKYLNRFAHDSAVRALAWCPFLPKVLASGGGAVDQCIKIWNISTGLCSRRLHTGSQVCALEWIKHREEILSAHGNQLSLWAYPSMSRVANFNRHSARVLHLAQNPGGTTVASAAADEILCFWEIFESSKLGGDQESLFSLKRMHIR